MAAAYLAVKTDCRKVPYLTAQMATNAAVRVPVETDPKRHKPLRVYRCMGCNHWHYGHAEWWIDPAEFVGTPERRAHWKAWAQ